MAMEGFSEFDFQIGELNGRFEVDRKYGFEQRITMKQYEWAREYMRINKNIGQRGAGDGTPHAQFMGKLGEVVVADALGIELALKSEGMDKGKDIVFGNLIIDVKCKTRRYQILGFYGWNVYAAQFDNPNFEANCYVFAGINDWHKEEMVKENPWVFMMAGWITRVAFGKRSYWLPAGTKRLRSDGKFFMEEGYEIPNYETTTDSLFPLHGWEDLKDKRKAIL